MNETRLRLLVDELDQLVPRDGAMIFEDEGLYGSEHDPAFVGNRAGYLRLGIEFVRIADAPTSPDRPTRVEADLGYLVQGDRSPGQRAIFEQTDVAKEEMRDAPPARGWPWGVVLLAAIGLAALALFMAR